MKLNLKKILHSNLANKMQSCDQLYGFINSIFTDTSAYSYTSIFVSRNISSFYQIRSNLFYNNIHESSRLVKIFLNSEFVLYIQVRFLKFEFVFVTLQIKFGKFVQVYQAVCVTKIYLNDKIFSLKAKLSY